MKIKKIVSGLIALSIVFGSIYVVSAKDKYVTRGQVAVIIIAPIFFGFFIGMLI